MSIELLQKLENKIDYAIETIELLKLQLEEAEEKNANLASENTALKNKQSSWESNLNIMLDKLNKFEVKERQVEREES